MRIVKVVNGLSLVAKTDVRINHMTVNKPRTIQGRKRAQESVDCRLRSRRVFMTKHSSSTKMLPSKPLKDLPLGTNKKSTIRETFRRHYVHCMPSKYSNAFYILFLATSCTLVVPDTMSLMVVRISEKSWNVVCGTFSFSQ